MKEEIVHSVKDFFERLRYHRAFCEEQWKLVRQDSWPFVDVYSQGLRQWWSTARVNLMNSFRPQSWVA